MHFRVEDENLHLKALEELSSSGSHPPCLMAGGVRMPHWVLVSRKTRCKSASISRHSNAAVGNIPP